MSPDVVRENRELHTLRAENVVLRNIATAAAVLVDLNPEITVLSPQRPKGWITLTWALDQAELAGVEIHDGGGAP